jgi:hypothetical protein
MIPKLITAPEDEICNMESPKDSSKMIKSIAGEDPELREKLQVLDHMNLMLKTLKTQFTHNE